MPVRSIGSASFHATVLDLFLGRKIRLDPSDVSRTRTRNILKNVRKSVQCGRMTVVTATKARAILYRLIDHLHGGQSPVLITGKRGNAVLVSEEDWRSIEETLSLLSIPGMRSSIRRGMREPVSRCSTEIDL